MAKQQAPKQKQATAPKGRERTRTRYGKRKGAAGGRHALRYYPKRGDKTDIVTRELYKCIVQMPSEKWGCDAAGKPTL